MILHACRWLLTGIFSVFLLTGCVSPDKGLAPSKHLSPCQKACVAELAACKKVCRNNCVNCQLGASESAMKGFERYLREQYVKGQMLTRELKSYRDPLQCRKTTCDCQADLNVCMQSCSGVIQKRLKPAPQCT
ncbi:acyltransferase [Legionella geestiana]|uniref:Acyltransferase n=1 Tax=Legionella geestiana TaxID=45065 RepID=A0A0W0TNC4_9GAMM|nr:acyltransferase [Legionella geestiana]QDQ38982.1 acyltransferase [Legionella geestiana]STX53915.1 acyltransferase [Legionella geestiana]